MFQRHNAVEYFHQRLTIRCILPEALHRKGKVGIRTQYIKILVSGFVQQCPPLRSLMLLYIKIPIDFTGQKVYPYLLAGRFSSCMKQKIQKYIIFRNNTVNTFV